MGPAAASLSLRERAGNDSCQSAETPCGCKRLRVLGFRVSGFRVLGFRVRRRLQSLFLLVEYPGELKVGSILGFPESQIPLN